MSKSVDGRGLAADDFDEDEIDWDNEGEPEEGESDGLSPIEELATAGSDIFDHDDDEPAEEDD